MSCGRSSKQLRANSEDTERLIDALLVLARSERGIEQWSPVDLASAVAQSSTNRRSKRPAPA